MKPGEFVGTDGLVYGVIQAIRVFEMAHGGHSAGVVCIDHPDFPAAVAALQSLLPKRTVHPAVGLRYCGEEAPLAEWISHGVKVRYVDGVVAIRDHIGGWKANSWQTDAFNAGREYERRQG